MKQAALIVLWLALGLQSHSQVSAQSFASRHCGAREITSGEEFDRLQRVGARLLRAASRNYVDNYVDIVLIDSNVINAWSINLGPAPGLVCIPIGLVKWQQDADGELAFIVGHELGHAWDESCKTISARGKLAKKSHSLGAILFGPSQGNELSDQRSCEFRADALGLRLLARAHYNAADAVTAFERMKELQQDHRQGVLGRLSAMGSDHPITSDRILRLKKLIARNLDF